MYLLEKWSVQFYPLFQGPLYQGFTVLFCLHFHLIFEFCYLYKSTEHMIIILWTETQNRLWRTHNLECKCRVKGERLHVQFEKKCCFFSVLLSLPQRLVKMLSKSAHLSTIYYMLMLVCMQCWPISTKFQWEDSQFEYKFKL